AVLIPDAHASLLDVLDESVLYIPQRHILVNEVEVLLPVDAAAFKLIDEILFNFSLANSSHTVSLPRPSRARAKICFGGATSPVLQPPCKRVFSTGGTPPDQPPGQTASRLPPLR